MGLSNGPGFTPQKTQFFEEKMLRLFMIFFLKNSSPFFLKPWRVGTSNINILLIGAIKNYNFFYCHFLLRPFLSEMFSGPFHQAKAKSSSRTVVFFNVSVACHGIFCVDLNYQDLTYGWENWLKLLMLGFTLPRTRPDNKLIVYVHNSQTLLGCLRSFCVKRWC